MCFLLMKMFGTEVWPVISPRAACISDPSAGASVSLKVRTEVVELLTLVVKLDNVDLGVVLDLLSEKGLGGLAVWAVALGEDDYEIG